MTRLYADHNATSPLRPEAREAMVRALDATGNPSSVHGEGRAARRIMEDSRESLAMLLGCVSETLTFTSGATEGLHLALESAAAQNFDHIYVSAVEHDAVWAFAKSRFPSAQCIPVDHNAAIDVDWFVARQQALGGRPLVIAQAANNETGTIQPIERLSTQARLAGGALLCDGVQMLGKLPASDFVGFADWLVVSAHKIGGPFGVGAVVCGPGNSLINSRPGGGQERGARAGTENVPAIAGFAAAAVSACSAEAIALFQAITSRERDAFEALLVSNGVPAEFIGRDANRLANTSCIAVKDWEAARQVMAIDIAGAAISSGSACSSGKVKSSRILAAAGYEEALAACAIRASFGWSTQPDDGTRLAEIYIASTARFARSNTSQAA